jgi:hypothetical protein
MGYSKIVQYGNVTEIYQYEKNLNKKPPSKMRLARLSLPKGSDSRHSHVSLNQKRKNQARSHAKRRGVYKRSKRSINRSRQNFYRLCHHNNCMARTIHFVTLTFPLEYELSYKTACRHVARFMERVKKNSPESPVSYISVPELTEAGQFHFHLLVYNLPTGLAGEPLQTRTQAHAKATTERKTRNLQVLFERGYVDIMPATYTSRGIAGYMAKYMGKALADTRYETTRGYNNSRNIAKITGSSGNTLDEHFDLIVPTDDLEYIENRVYDVPYLGTCRFTKITKKL